VKDTEIVVVPCIVDTLAGETVVDCEVMEVLVVTDAMLARMLAVGDDKAESGDGRLVVAETELSVLVDAPCERLVMYSTVESEVVETDGLLILRVDDDESDNGVVWETELLVVVVEVLSNGLIVWSTPPELTKLDDCAETKIEDIEDVESGVPLNSVAFCVVDPPVVVYCIDDTLETVVKLLRLVR